MAVSFFWTPGLNTEKAETRVDHNTFEVLLMSCTFILWEYNYVPSYVYLKSPTNAARFLFMEFIGMTLVNKITLVFSAQFYNTSVHCVMCSLP